MKRLLVTGGAGFIGCNFVRHWLDRHADDRLVVLDALTYAGHRDSLPEDPRLTFVQGDICDEGLVRSLFDEHGSCTVVHFAAESHVDRSIDGPDEFLRTNLIGTHTLLKLAREAWAEADGERRFHHVSTDEVYGSLGSDDPPFTEDTAYAPNSPYSATKAGSDHLVRAYHSTYGVPVTISNCSNNYGPYQHPEKLIPTVITRALGDREIPIYGDGLQRRDWLFVGDHCDALERVLLDGEVGRTYMVGGGADRTNLELVHGLCTQLDAQAPREDGRPHRDRIVHVTDRPGHDRRYAVATDRIRDDLAWEPAHALDAALAETVAWYLGNRDWVDAVTGTEVLGRVGLGDREA